MDKEVKKTNGVEKVTDKNLSQMEKEKLKKEKWNAYMRDYYERNKEKIRQKRRERYQEQKDKELEQQKERYQTDAEYRQRKIENKNNWVEENREYVNEYQRQYRNRKNNN